VRSMIFVPVAAGIGVVGQRAVPAFSAEGALARPRLPAPMLPVARIGDQKSLRQSVRSYANSGRYQDAEISWHDRATRDSHCFD